MLNRDTVRSADRQLDGLLATAGRLAPEYAACLAGRVLHEAGVNRLTVDALMGELAPAEQDALVELGDDWLDGRPAPVN